jgi:(1->4)-alpha-D-glucan 1-alpha-D-glucosylmutase
VGGDPGRFGVSVEEFHRHCAQRQATWPGAMSTTATHDTKRGEDVRARINVLSEMPRAWRDAVRRWHRFNRRHATAIEGERAPGRNDEYLLYQTLLGAWPLGADTAAERAELTARIQGYMTKASREAKVNTSWVNPNQVYDEALARFVERVLDPGVSARFLADFAAFREPLARFGMVNGLAQALLKIAAPGVPDFYQGTEVWDLSLVDPDNRRPVDFEARTALLAGLRDRIASGDLGGLARELVESWPDGRIKLYTVHRALGARRAAPEIFRSGAYLPLATAGRHAAHVCAFARQSDAGVAIAVVPRLTTRLTGNGARLPLGRDVWADTRVLLPPDLAEKSFIDAFTGAEHRGRPAGQSSGDPSSSLLVGELLAHFPVALCVDGQSPSSAPPEPRR